jgi:purine-nucleoside phosphorylase
MTQSDHLANSLSYIRDRVSSRPEVAIVLGSGLGDFADALPGAIALSTADIPHYPKSSVEGHKGRLIFASIAGREILAFQGRVHFYESHSVETVLYPIRVAELLGVKTIVLTNAAGGINRSFLPGDLMLIADHINFTSETVPSKKDELQRSNPVYASRLLTLASTKAEELGIPLRSGVYVGLKGPSYETAAEIEMLGRLGGDAVGMSTVLESSFAASLGMDVLGISCITNLGTGIGTTKLSHAEVTEVGNRVKKSFARLLMGIIEGL